MDKEKMAELERLFALAAECEAELEAELDDPDSEENQYWRQVNAAKSKRGIGPNAGLTI
jgi:hypothetical protein